MDTSEPRCEGCGNCIDREDLFCSNCGRQAPGESQAAAAPIEEGFVGFDCETCGASLTYDSEAEGLRCAFCGAVTLKRQPRLTGRVRVESFLPFAVTRDRAMQSFRSWIGRGFFRPFGFQRGARVASMSPVYIPCWRFHATAHTYYAGDTSRTPPLARADWCPVFGEQEGRIADILVPASGSLSAGELAAIEPFDSAQLRPYQREALQGHVVEDFGLSRRGARPFAHRRMLDAERARAATQIPAKSRNVHVCSLFQDLHSAPVLLPVWINSYRFADRTYRFLINGQTGELVGHAPFSYGKLALVIAAVLAALGLAAVIASA